MSHQDFRLPPHVAPDKLLDLVMGLMSPAARQAALEHLASCRACEARLRETAATYERTRAQAGDVLGAGSLPPLELHPAGRATRRALPRGVASGLLIAAGFAAIAGVFALLRTPLQPTSRAPETLVWLPAPDASVLTRGSTNAADSLVLAGLEAYERRDLAGARALLERGRSDGSMEQVRRVYLAHSLLGLEQPTAALDLLHSVDFPQVPEPWRSESRWTLREALARTGERAAADSLARVLATEPGPVGNRARAELQHGQR